MLDFGEVFMVPPRVREVHSKIFEFLPDDGCFAQVQLT
jgi:hypothetical protein